MSKIPVRRAALAVLLGALPLPSLGQDDAAAVLEPVADALHIENVASLRVVASGSGYEPEAPAGANDAAGQSAAAPGVQKSAAAVGAKDPRAAVKALLAAPEGSLPDEAPSAGQSQRHYRIVRFVEEVDLASQTARIELVRGPGAAEPAATGGEEQVTVTIGADSPWRERLRFFTSPYGFLSAALANDPAVSTETILGTEYRVVSFDVDGHEIKGYIDGENRLVRIATSFEDESGEPTEVVATYLDWRELGDVTFPSTLIRKLDGDLAEVLIVSEVETTPGGGSA